MLKKKKKWNGCTVLLCFAVTVKVILFYSISILILSCSIALQTYRILTSHCIILYWNVLHRNIVSHRIAPYCIKSYRTITYCTVSYRNSVVLYRDVPHHSISHSAHWMIKSYPIVDDCSLESKYVSNDVYVIKGLGFFSSVFQAQLIDFNPG